MSDIYEPSIHKINISNFVYYTIIGDKEDTFKRQLGMFKRLIRYKNENSDLTYIELFEILNKYAVKEEININFNNSPYFVIIKLFFQIEVLKDLVSGKIKGDDKEAMLNKIENEGNYLMNLADPMIYIPSFVKAIIDFNIYEAVFQKTFPTFQQNTLSNSEKFQKLLIFIQENLNKIIEQNPTKLNKIRQEQHNKEVITNKLLTSAMTKTIFDRNTIYIILTNDILLNKYINNNAMYTKLLEGIENNFSTINPHIFSLGWNGYIKEETKHQFLLKGIELKSTLIMNALKNIEPKYLFGVKEPGSIKYIDGFKEFILQNVKNATIFYNNVLKNPIYYNYQKNTTKFYFNESNAEKIVDLGQPTFISKIENLLQLAYYYRITQPKSLLELKNELGVKLQQANSEINFKSHRVRRVIIENNDIFKKLINNQEQMKKLFHLNNIKYFDIAHFEDFKNISMLVETIFEKASNDSDLINSLEKLQAEIKAELFKQIQENPSIINQINIQNEIFDSSIILENCIKNPNIFNEILKNSPFTRQLLEGKNEENVKILQELRNKFIMKAVKQGNHLAIGFLCSNLETSLIKNQLIIPTNTRVKRKLDALLYLSSLCLESEENAQIFYNCVLNNRMYRNDKIIYSLKTNCQDFVKQIEIKAGIIKNKQELETIRQEQSEYIIMGRLKEQQRQLKQINIKLLKQKIDNKEEINFENLEMQRIILEDNEAFNMIMDNSYYLNKLLSIANSNLLDSIINMKNETLHIAIKVNITIETRNKFLIKAIEQENENNQEIKDLFISKLTNKNNQNEKNFVLENKHNAEMFYNYILPTIQEEQYLMQRFNKHCCNFIQQVKEKAGIIENNVLLQQEVNKFQEVIMAIESDKIKTVGNE